MDAEVHALFVDKFSFSFCKYLKADWLNKKIRVHNSHFKKLPNYFPKGLCHLAFPPAEYKTSSVSLVTPSAVGQPVVCSVFLILDV